MKRVANSSLHCCGMNIVDDSNEEVFLPRHAEGNTCGAIRKYPTKMKKVNGIAPCTHLHSIHEE